MMDCIKEIIAPVFSGEPDWDSVPEYGLDNHMWAQAYPAFWRTCVKICAVKNKGIYARFCSDESPVKADYFNRDDPVYTDSCAELFLQPFSDDLRYVNIEINPNCAYLSAIGADRFDRVFASSVSAEQCFIKRLILPCGWGVELFVPNSFISSLYSREFALCGEIRANIYKCGDETEHPHYASAFFVDTPEPDFHRPEFFGLIKFSPEKE